MNALLSNYAAHGVEAPDNINMRAPIRDATGEVIAKVTLMNESCVPTPEFAQQDNNNSALRQNLKASIITTNAKVAKINNILIEGDENRF